MHRIKNPVDELVIHVVGKYTGYEDSYKSLNEAVFHGGFAHRLRVKLNWVEAEALEKEGGSEALAGSHGILVPGGFGSRGRGCLSRRLHRVTKMSSSWSCDSSSLKRAGMATRPFSSKV